MPPRSKAASKKPSIMTRPTAKEKLLELKPDELQSLLLGRTDGINVPFLKAYCIYFDIGSEHNKSTWSRPFLTSTIANFIATHPDLSDVKLPEDIPLELRLSPEPNSGSSTLRLTDGATHNGGEDDDEEDEESEEHKEDDKHSDDEENDEGELGDLRFKVKGDKGTDGNSALASLMNSPSKTPPAAQSVPSKTPPNAQTGMKRLGGPLSLKNGATSSSPDLQDSDPHASRSGQASRIPGPSSSQASTPAGPPATTVSMPGTPSTNPPLKPMTRDTQRLEALKRRHKPGLNQSLGDSATTTNTPRARTPHVPPLSNTTPQPAIRPTAADEKTPGGNKGEQAGGPLAREKPVPRAESLTTNKTKSPSALSPVPNSAEEIRTGQKALGGILGEKKAEAENGALEGGQTFDTPGEATTTPMQTDQESGNASSREDEGAPMPAEATSTTAQQRESRAPKQNSHQKVTDDRSPAKKSALSTTPRHTQLITPSTGTKPPAGGPNNKQKSRMDAESVDRLDELRKSKLEEMSSLSHQLDQARHKVHKLKLELQKAEFDLGRLTRREATLVEEMEELEEDPPTFVPSGAPETPGEGARKGESEFKQSGALPQQQHDSRKGDHDKLRLDAKTYSSINSYGGSLLKSIASPLQDAVSLNKSHVSQLSSLLGQLEKRRGMQPAQEAKAALANAIQDVEGAIGRLT